MIEASILQRFRINQSSIPCLAGPGDNGVLSTRKQTMKDTEKLALIYQNLTAERQLKISDLVIALLLEQVAEEQSDVLSRALDSSELWRQGLVSR